MLVRTLFPLKKLRAILFLLKFKISKEKEVVYYFRGIETEEEEATSNKHNGVVVVVGSTVCAVIGTVREAREAVGAEAFLLLCTSQVFS